MNILVTGNRGFLGRHLVPELLKRYTNANIFVSNTSENNLRRPLGNIINIPLDYIFHLAAWTKAGDFCLYHPAEQWNINHQINYNIMDYWWRYQPQAKMITMGTSCAYDPDIIKTADNYGKGNLDEYLSAYAMTKRMLYVGLQAYAQQWDMNYLVFVPTTLCGPQFDQDDTHFIFDLVKKFCYAKRNNIDVTLWGNGHQKREIMYVKDAVRLMLDNLDLNNQVINLSTGQELTIRQYADMISTIVEFTGNIIYDESKFTGVTSKQLIPTIPYTPTNLIPVLEEMIQYATERFNS